MGSVGEDYRCPLCGRTGMGGYSPDWIGFPICTEGDYNCLDKVCPSDTSDDATPFAADVVAEALGKIIGGVRAFKQYPEASTRSKSFLLRHVVSFLGFDMLESIEERKLVKRKLVKRKLARTIVKRKLVRTCFEPGTIVKRKLVRTIFSVTAKAGTNGA